MAMTEHAVVIAGGGPTGLMLAGELALAGIDVAIVERREGQELEGTRAGGLHARTLEVLDQRGLAERFVAQGQAMQIASFGRNILDLSDCPTRFNHGLALSQRHIERTLAEWVVELGVKQYRRCELTGHSQSDTHVDVELADGRTLRTEYLVGCDGGRSRVRKSAGIAFPGSEPSISYLIAEVETDETPLMGFRRGERGIHAIGRHEDGTHFRMVLSEPRVGRGEPTLDELRAVLVSVYGTDFGLSGARHLSRFTDMARQAETYRTGRVLLAGDAAHVHSPIGGQGLNTGIQDAVNLGWKLAQVVQVRAPDALLDSYHSERHPVGARVLRHTLAQTALDRGDVHSEAVRESLSELLQLDAPRRRYAAMMSGLDIHYDLGAGHPLLGRRMPDLTVETAAGPQRVYEMMHQALPLLLVLGESNGIPESHSPWEGRVRRCDARHGDALELPVLGEVPAPDAVLIRPDGHVAWVGQGTTEGLRDALERWFGPSGAREH